MTDYVLGFMHQGPRVALIRKNKPLWQKGRLNGIGGKIENGETPLEAMSREFYEEAGVWTGWRHFLNITWPEGKVYCFETIGDLSILKTMEEEQIEIHYADRLNDDILPNLKWMIPLAMYAEDKYDVIDVIVTKEEI